MAKGKKSAKDQRKREIRKKGLSRRNLLVIILATLAVGALIGASLWFPRSKTVSSTDQGSYPSAITDSGEPTLGSADAPVTIIEFSDFQCPFCSRFTMITFKQIEEEYVGTGLVKVVFRQFAFLGQESQWAAEAAECANEQGRFWEYHDKLFSSQAGENRGAFSKSNLKRFAAELGLGTQAFNQCLDSGRYADEVKEDTAEGKRRGVQGTPTFFVNGQKLVGAQPFSEFQRIIAEELRKAQ